jgi:hypothetical protein
MQTADQAFPDGINQNRPRKKLGAAFLLLPISAVIMFGLSIWYAYSSFMFYNNGVQVEGTVVRLASSGGSDIAYSPVFRYTVDGVDYEYESVNSSNPPTHRVGDVTTLLYDPDNPAKARENSFWELWLIPVILCPVSIMMLMLSIVIPMLVRAMPQ